MFSRILAALAGVLWIGGVALAAGDGPPPAGRTTPTPGLFQGTAEEQAACAPDAARFCTREIPDTLRVLGCLQENRRKLRKVCLHVLESHGM